MPNAYSYVRFSTPEQMKGDSIRRQTKLSEEFAAKNELTLVRQYSDFGVSSFRGTNRDKGALKVFLDAVESGRIERGSWLLVESLDRISRDKVSEALPRFIDLLNAGIIIATLQDGRVYDRRSADDAFQLIGSLVVMATAHEESLKKSHRTKSAWKARREKGKKGVLCPAWLKLSADGQTYEEIPNRVDLLRRIFALAINGLGSFTIARLLNQEGEAPFSAKLKDKPRAGRTARGWHAASVRDLLTSRAVLGESQPYHREGHTKILAGDPIKGFFPQVIDPVTFDRAQAARRHNGKVKGRRGNTFANLFLGIGHCAHCQGPMQLSYSRQRPYLICGNRKNGIACRSEGGKGFNYEKTEAAILDHVAEYRLSELFANPTADAELKIIEGQLAALAEKAADLQKSQSGLVREIAKLDDDDPTREDYQAGLREGRAELDNTKDRVKSLQQQRADLLLQQDQRTDIDAEITRMREDLARFGSDEPKVITVRAKLASALRSFISTIQFDTVEGIFDVILGGGLVAYRFQRSAKRHGPQKDYSISFMDRFSFVDGVKQGTHPREAFVTDDETFIRLMNG